MLITRTPFRVSFMGGGSDLPAFYTKSEGAVLSTTINKYIYVSVHPFFNSNQIHLKYSKAELCNSVSEIEHPILKEIFKYLGIKGGTELTATADIPSGTGLGSSSSFTVGSLHCLYSYLNKLVDKEKLADEACVIEIEKLKEPIGKQDQYAASYGGFNIFIFKRDGRVVVKPLNIKKSTLKELNENLLMFYTSETRSAKKILTQQQEEIKKEKKFNAQKKMVELVPEIRDSLFRSDLTRFGELLHKGWLLKSSLTSSISNPQIDKHYNLAIKSGATGGKLLGAGGGGFLLFYCEKEKQEKLINALSELPRFDFSFDKDGTKIVYIGD